jgi:hypothetical protein
LSGYALSSGGADLIEFKHAEFSYIKKRKENGGVSKTLSKQDA